MKRSDLKAGIVFRYHMGSTWYRIKSDGFEGMQVWEHQNENCDDRGRLEGYLKETDSNKGFTLTRYIVGKQVAAFFPFNQFEVINQ